jgi:putative ABC transport system permease protein
MRLALPPQYYRTPEDRRRFFAQLDERLASVTGFRSVTMASHAPLEPFGATRELLVEGGAGAPGETAPVVSFVLAGSRYFDAVKLPLVRGRDFTDADARRGSEGVVVDQQIAARFFANEDPIGRRIRFRATPPPGRPPSAVVAEPGPWFTIVGVAQTVPQYGPAALIRPVAYVPLGSEPAPDARAIVLVRGPLLASAAALREEVRAIDSRLPIFAIETMESALARARFPVRLIGTWFGTLALVALLLAAVGLYALTAHGVAQRVHEIGVRMALGAEAREVVWWFVRRTIVQLVVGVTVGLAGALSVGQLLHGASARDPLTVAIVTALLVGVTVMATLLPARRAAHVDPVVALRAE